MHVKFVLLEEIFKNLKKAAEQICSENLSVLKFDVKDIQSIIPKLNEAACLLGGYYDGIINSAGVLSPVDNWNISEETWDSVIDTDLKAAVFLMRKAVI